MARIFGKFVVRVDVIVSTIVSVLLVCIGIALLLFPPRLWFPPPDHLRPLPGHSVHIDLWVQLGATDRLVEGLRKFATANGFDFHARSDPRGRTFVRVGMVRKDIYIQASPAFDDWQEVLLRVTQDEDDKDPATPARVDELMQRLKKEVLRIPGVETLLPGDLRRRLGF